MHCKVKSNFIGVNKNISNRSSGMISHLLYAKVLCEALILNCEKPVDGYKNVIMNLLGVRIISLKLNEE